MITYDGNRFIIDEEFGIMTNKNNNNEQNNPLRFKLMEIKLGV